MYVCLYRKPCINNLKGKVNVLKVTGCSIWNSKRPPTLKSDSIWMKSENLLTEIQVQKDWVALRENVERTKRATPKSITANDPINLSEESSS